MSLCHALLMRGVTDPILILDQKPAFADDRTWCFWTTGFSPFQSLVSHCWHQWKVVDRTGATALQTASSVGYACLRGKDFYAHVLRDIRSYPNVTLRLNCQVASCTSQESSVSVCTADGKTFRGEYGFDSRPQAFPSSETQAGLTFSQNFFGQLIHCHEPIFDPSCCTLMDFRVPQERGLHFLYILPFSRTEALVENTYIQNVKGERLTAEQHRHEILHYLAKHHTRRSFDVIREEAGAIPMTLAAFPKRAGRIFFIGTAGGCTKPSSGYTFQRIQEQVRQIADAAAAGHLADFREKPPPFHFRFFDAVFLQAMQDRPKAFSGYFFRLFSRVPPAALTSFLSETSTWRSNLCIIFSLPPGPFLQAAIRALPRLFWNG